MDANHPPNDAHPTDPRQSVLRQQGTLKDPRHRRPESPELPPAHAISSFPTPSADLAPFHPATGAEQGRGIKAGRIPPPSHYRGNAKGLSS